MNPKETKKVIHECLMQAMENLPLFERFSFRSGVLRSLTVQEAHTIALIGKLGSPRMSELARRAHVTLSTMTVMVSKLVKKGYARRVSDGRDRRVVRVTLTTRGRRVERAHERHHEQMVDMLMGALTKAEQEQVARLIQKIVITLR
jgi:DNA-binding MarR family transcriptional regulator